MQLLLIHIAWNVEYKAVWVEVNVQQVWILVRYEVQTSSLRRGDKPEAEGLLTITIQECGGQVSGKATALWQIERKRPPEVRVQLSHADLGCHDRHRANRSLGPGAALGGSPNLVLIFSALRVGCLVHHYHEAVTDVARA